MNETIHSLRLKGYKVRVMHWRKFICSVNFKCSLIVSYHGIPEPINFNPILSPNGGKTVIQLRSPEGIEVEGVAICSEKDSFNRKYGNVKALARALGKLNKIKSVSVGDTEN